MTLMRRPPFRWSDGRMPLLVLSVSVAALCLGCDDQSDDPLSPSGSAPDTTTFTGAYLSATQQGSLVVRVPLDPASMQGGAGSSLPVLGALQSGGAEVALTGTYNPATGALILSGGEYSLDGAFRWTHDNPTLDGAWSNPTSLGAFATSSGGAEHPVATYLGDYSNLANNFILGSLAVFRTEWWVRGFVAPAGGGSLMSVSGSITNNATGAIAFSGTSGTTRFSFHGSLNLSSGAGDGYWEQYAGFDQAGAGTWETGPVP